MIVDWKSFKKFVDDTKLYNFLNYFEMSDTYYVWLAYQNENFSLVLQKGSKECEDFVDNYKSKAILKDDIANDGISYTKITHVLTGRYLRDVFATFKTSTFELNDETGLFSVKLFNAQGNETQVSAEAVKTAVDFCPNYTYEIYAGGVETLEDLHFDFYVSAIIAPDIPEQSGGSLYYIRNKLILQPRENIMRSGVGTAEVLYNSQVPLASKLRIYLKHPVGEQHKFQLELQYYA